LPFLVWKDYKSYCAGQIGFISKSFYNLTFYIETFVVPLFEELSKLEPKVNILVDRINSNIDKYGEEIANCA
jgi:hypothetical protein